MKIIRVQSNLTIILNDGTLLTSNECDDELYNEIIANQDKEDKVRNLVAPILAIKEKKVEEVKEFIEKSKTSKYLTFLGSSIYFKGVSELSLPEDLYLAIMKAEKENNLNLIESYKNFWTLVSLNPDSRARMNLFWFLNKYGMTITKSGMFVAFRNVQIKKVGKEVDEKLSSFISASYLKVKGWKKSILNYNIVEDKGELFLVKKDNVLEPGVIIKGNLSDLYNKLSEQGEEVTTYTDNYTRSFNIQIGKVVTLDRSKCDAVQENTCSQGLHVASKSWLDSNGSGFGSTSLVVLVNPADVVAVPPRDSYGKMRVCAYYPLSVVQKNASGQIIEPGIEEGFEDDFMSQVTYSGDKATEQNAQYVVEIPKIPEINRNEILKRISEIKASLKKRYVN